MPLDTNREEQVLYPPVESCACPAGYAGGIFGDTYTDKVKPEVLYRLSAMILRDELAIRDLSERVYQLLVDEVRIRQERSQRYQGRL
jgi:hypothetical protein